MAMISDIEALVSCLWKIRDAVDNADKNSHKCTELLRRLERFYDAFKDMRMSTDFTKHAEAFVKEAFSFVSQFTKNGFVARVVFNADHIKKFEELNASLDQLVVESGFEENRRLHNQMEVGMAQILEKISVVELMQKAIVDDIQEDKKLLRKMTGTLSNEDKFVLASNAIALQAYLKNAALPLPTADGEVFELFEEPYIADLLSSTNLNGVDELQIADLKAEVLEVRSKLLILEAQVLQLTFLNGQQTEELTAANAKITPLENENADLKEKLSASEAENKQLNDELETSQNDCNVLAHFVSASNFKMPGRG